MKIPVPPPPEPTPAASDAGGLGSWLDEELEAEPPVAVAPAMVPATCPSCGASMAAGAVMCVVCGYDARTGVQRETRHELEPAADGGKKGRRRVKLGFAASLLRGTIFSFLAAMMGAVIWAALAYFTMREFGIVAWGLGGLAGLGMALGHEDDDGTMAGIIAAFMSLVGIIAAKILIVVIIVGAALGMMFGQLDLDENADPVAVQRELVALTAAQERLQEQGVELVTATDEQWEQAMEAARAEVADLTEEELEQRMAALDQAAEPDDLQEEEGEVDAEVDVGGPPVEEVEEPSLIALFFSEMFDPIDGIFILLAFFTAYKVGSSQMTD